jgi:hypothetical protein
MMNMMYIQEQLKSATIHTTMTVKEAHGFARMIISALTMYVYQAKHAVSLTTIYFVMIHYSAPQMISVA